MTPKISPALLTGQTRAHVMEWDGISIHREIHSAFLAMQKAALQAGHNLKIASGFRSFEAQLSIWNQKASGKRAVLDKNGNPIDITGLSPDELVFAILRWSAIPGASRHHWGTDIDVFDAAALKNGEKLLLSPQEIEPGGTMQAFDLWLSEHSTRFGFFRPYQIDLGGVAPEWWHLSYAPLSTDYLNFFSIELLREALSRADLQLKQTVLERLDSIYKMYVQNISNP